MTDFLIIFNEHFFAKKQVASSEFQNRLDLCIALPPINNNNNNNKKKKKKNNNTIFYIIYTNKNEDR